jgi:small-conductance mechanosensitive channel
MSRRFGSALAPLICALALVCAAAGDAQAQLRALRDAAQGGSSQPPTSAAPAAPADPRAPIQARLAELEREAGELRKRSETPLQTGALPLLEGALIADEQSALSAQLGAFDRADELARLRSEADARAAAGPSAAIPHPPPYTLADLDAAMDARDAAAQRVENAARAARAGEEALTAATAHFEASEATRRQAREAAEAEKGDDVAGARLREASRRAQLDSRVAQARRELAALELENARRELALQQQNAQLLREAVELARENLSADRTPLRERLAALDEREIARTQALERSQRAKELADQRLALVERRLEASPAPDPVLAAEAEARRTERQVAERRLTADQLLLQRIAAQRQLLQRRYEALVDTPPARELRALETELDALTADRARELRLAQARRTELEQELADARARAETEEASGAPGAAWYRRRADALAGWLVDLDGAVAELASEQRLVDRTLEDLRAHSTRGGVLAGLRALGSSIGDVWQVELFAVQDYSITVGKIAGALLLFALGVLLARVTSGLVGRVLERRAGYDHGAASAVRGLLYYSMLAVFFLFALRAMDIPLTAFTVIGGALAIGVGFGSQTVIGNFISGLILMAERPIKEGDLVEVDGTKGTVERIGPRSTRVRTFDNTHLIVPNNLFLEKTVRNMTLTNEDIRATVSVGVAYGSPLRDVERLILRAIQEQGKVLEYPEPAVFFTSFGDSALVFQAFFWIRSRDMSERYRIESDVRHQIDALLREAGITIAFPQRDVHLHAATPLEVHVVPRDPGKPA